MVVPFRVKPPLFSPASRGGFPEKQLIIVYCSREMKKVGQEGRERDEVGRDGKGEKEGGRVRKPVQRGGQERSALTAGLIQTHTACFHLHKKLRVCAFYCSEWDPAPYATQLWGRTC